MHVHVYSRCEHVKEEKENVTKREGAIEREMERERELHLNVSLPASCTKV